MTYETTSGRHPVRIVELDQDFCSLEYGVYPCQAELGVTGAKKCFNTLRTCQDEENYSPGTLTLRFAESTSALPRDPSVVLIPSLQSVDSRPTRIDPGRGLGVRASIKITLLDHPYHDRLTDKYASERGYDAAERGTFWTRWRARNPYYQNRAIRVKEGYIGQSLAEMRTRHYFLDRVEGPDANGRVTITAKDVLKLADDERAVAPRPTQVVLSEDVDDYVLSFEVEALVNFSLDEELPPEGIIRVGSEVMTYTRSGYALDVVRGQFGTEAESHDAGDTVQLCLRYQSEAVQDIAYDLLVNYANIDPAWIPKYEWDAEGGVWLSGYNLTTLITEPTGVNTLITELSEQCLFFVWWDEIAQEIPFRALRPAFGDIPHLDDARNLVADSVSVADDPSQRISQVHIYYSQRNPTVRLSERANFARLRVRRDVDAEGENEYGETRIREIFSRWFTSANDGQTLTTGTRLLNAYRDNPRRVEWSLDAKDRELIGTGSVADLQTRWLTDDTGLPRQTRLIVLSTEEVEPGHRVEYIGQDFQLLAARFARFMAYGSPDYLYASDEERATGGWFCDENGLMGDGSDGYTFV